MVFYMKTWFIILESPILHVHFLQNLPTMNILDPIFYRTLFYDFRQWTPQAYEEKKLYLTWPSTNKSRDYNQMQLLW